MIHLHFGGKDKLLAAAAESFSKEYYHEMERQVEGTEDDPVNLVMAVIRADLSPELLNERSVKIWHAFRGVSSTNAEIARFSDTRDKRLRHMINDAFDAIVEAENIMDGKLLARDATYGTLTILEGMWTDYLTHLHKFSREDASRIIRRFLSGLFPTRFGSG